MKIKGEHYRTLWPGKDNQSLYIIDQSLLPFKFEIKELKTVKEIYTAIKDMSVRGAPLIGATAAFGMYFAVKNHNLDIPFDEHIAQSAEFIKSSRPTAVNLNYCVDKMIEAINCCKDGNDKAKAAFDEAVRLTDKEAEMSKMIGVHGLSVIEKISKAKSGETVNILTHCNAGWLACVDYGTATAPIYLAHEKGIKLHVWVDETRPRNQGARLTAWELGENNIPHTIIPDNAGGHLMQHNMVDIVITGSDRTTCTGDVANKIGTYLKALAANDNNIPFYVALPSSTIDWNITDGINQIPIEERDKNEVKYIEGFIDGEIKNVLLCPEKSPAANYGFDVTPARLVSGLITEKGICKADKKSILNLFEM